MFVLQQRLAMPQRRCSFDYAAPHMPRLHNVSNNLQLSHCCTQCYMHWHTTALPLFIAYTVIYCHTFQQCCSHCNAHAEAYTATHYCPTVPRCPTLCRTLLQCHTLPHYRTNSGALPHTATPPHSAVNRLPNSLSLPRTPPLALPHTAACTSAQHSYTYCCTLLYCLPFTATLPDNRTSLLHALPHCYTATHCHTRTTTHALLHTHCCYALPHTTVLLITHCLTYPPTAA